MIKGFLIIKGLLTIKRFLCFKGFCKGIFVNKVIFVSSKNGFQY